jgi:hypothetical protein
VQLPLARQQQFVVCGSRHVADGPSSSSSRCIEVLILSSSPRLFGSMAYESTGSGNAIGRKRQAGRLVGQRVAGARVLQLGHGAEVAGLEFRHRACVLPCSTSRWPSRSCVPRGVSYRGVGLERALVHAEHRDAAGELVGHRLPDERRVRRLVVGRARPGPRPVTARKRPVGRGGRRRDGVEQRLDADVLEARGAEQREQACGAVAVEARTSSSCVSVPASKNFSISCSSASATISISASRAAVPASAVSFRRDGAFVIWPEPSVGEAVRLHRTRSTTPVNVLSSPSGS